MNKNQIINLPFDELQSQYELYLYTQNFSKATVKTTLSDAFYIWRKGSKDLFWHVLTSTKFEEDARNTLLDLLTINSKGNKYDISSYMSHLRRFRKFLDSKESTQVADIDVKAKVKVIRKNKNTIIIPRPSKEEVKKYLLKWKTLDDYSLQEDALDKLFFELCPNNENISDILLKSSTLNDFYSTNIFKIYPLARHILRLNIDSRLISGDVNLVKDIQFVKYDKGIKNFYSFATKYCSHHKPLDYPIYDSYVDIVLRHFRKCDEFSIFQDSDLKDYPKFKDILLDFQSFYGLNEYNLKQIDQYLWLLGKDYFPKNYKKKYLENIR